MTHWQPNFSLSGKGEPGTYIFQLILDHGASEVVLTVLTDERREPQREEERERQLPGLNPAQQPCGSPSTSRAAT